MLVVPSYVFPATGADELIQLVSDHLRAYLEDPYGTTSDLLSDDLKSQAAVYAAAGDFVGINTAPVFVLRPGGGGVGDEDVTGVAKVIYLDDEKPGGPFIRIYVDELGAAEDWNGKIRQPVAFVLDHNASDFNGAITGGVNSNDATSALQGVAWRLLSPTSRSYPLLKTWGFNDPGTRAGALARDGLELHAPFTFGADIYYQQP